MFAKQTTYFYPMRNSIESSRLDALLKVRAVLKRFLWKTNHHRDLGLLQTWSRNNSFHPILASKIFFLEVSEFVLEN